MADSTATVEVRVDGQKARVQIRRMRQDFKQFSRNTQRSMDSIRDSFRKLGRDARILKAGIAGLAAAAGVAGIRQLAVSTAEAGDEIAKMARQIGISGQALQEYQFAGDRVGVSQRTLTRSLGAFTKRLGELQAGGGQLASMLEKTNPGLLQQLETVTDTDQAMQMVLGAIGGMETASARNALAAAAFSRAGQDMVRVAEAGADEISRLREQARAFGLVMSDKALAASEAFMDSQTNLGAAFRGVANIIGAELMPRFTAAMDSVTEFIVRNRELIQTQAEKWIARAASAFEAMSSAVKFAANNMDILAIAAAAFIGRKVGGVAAAIGQQMLGLAGALTKAAGRQAILNAVMLINPFVVVATAVAVLTAAIALNWTETVKLGDGTVQLRDIVVGAWNMMKEAARPVAEFIVWVLESLGVETVSAGSAFDKLKGVVVDTFAFIMPFVKSNVNAMIKSFQLVFSLVARAGNAVNSVLGVDSGPVFSGLLDEISGIVTGDPLGGFAENLRESAAAAAATRRELEALAPPAPSGSGVASAAPSAGQSFASAAGGSPATVSTATAEALRQQAEAQSRLNDLAAPALAAGQQMLETQQQIALVQGQGVEAEQQALLMREQGAERLREVSTEWADSAGRAFGEYVTEATNGAKQLEGALGNAFSRAENALTGFIQTGKFEFSSFIADIGSQLAKLASKQLLGGVMGMFGGGGGIGGLLGGLFANGGAFDGGVQKFARGGVVKAPTVFPMAKGAGLMGEAGPEAVMPLKRLGNGALGVQASGRGGGQTNVTTNVSVSVQGGGGDEQSAQQMGKVIARAVEAQVQQVLGKQMRPGGALNKGLSTA